MKTFLKLFSILFLFVSLNSAAQTDKTVYNYGAFKEGAIARLFGDKVNIRSGPSVKDKIVANLPIGTPLTIIRKSEEAYKMNEFISNWYEVSFFLGKDEKKGYVWGGLLSLISFEVPNNPGGKKTWLVYGITAYDTATYKFSSQLRLFRNDSLISTLSFEPIFSPLGGERIYSYCIGGEILDNHGFTGISNIVKLEYIYGACGFNNGNILVFIKGKDLIYGVEAIEVGEAGIFSYTYELIYPDQVDGKANKLLVKYNIKNFKEDMTIERDTSYSKEYQWDGSKMIKSD
jgi:hypothetical protein